MPQAPEQLTQHNCIGFSEQHSGRGTWHLFNGKENQQVNFYPALRCDDMATILRVTQSDAGVGMIPAFVCKDLLTSGLLERVLPQWKGPDAEFFLVFPERELMPNRVRLLTDFLIERSRSEKWRLSLSHAKPA